MYDQMLIGDLSDRMAKIRTSLYDAFDERKRRIAVSELREIATELDCLKPVDNPLFADALDPTTYPEDAPIPAAPGPDYATKKELDAAVGTLNSTALVDRNAVLALTDRVELIEKALARPVNTIEPDQEWQRQHLYNQAYLAALPAVVRRNEHIGAIAPTAADIATQSMEYLK